MTNFIELCHAVRRGLIAYHGYQRRAKRTESGGAGAEKERWTCLRNDAFIGSEGAEEDTLFLDSRAPLSPAVETLGIIHVPVLRAERTAEQRPYVHVSQSRNTIFRFLL